MGTGVLVDCGSDVGAVEHTHCRIGQTCATGPVCSLFCRFGKSESVLFACLSLAVGCWLCAADKDF